MDIDKELLKMKVVFSGPHPGFAGAAIPLQQDIKKFIDDLAQLNKDSLQKLITLQEGLNKIKTVVGNRGELKIRMTPHHKISRSGTVFLYIPNTTDAPRHCFRLIYFMEIITDKEYRKRMVAMHNHK